MCVSFAPAIFTGATAMACEVGDGTDLLGYSNSADNRNGQGANCMVLHVPTDQLTADSLIPTDDVPNFMEAMGNAVYSLKPAMRGMTLGFDGPMAASFSAPIHVVYGAYEIVLASNASDIPGALGMVSDERRPSLNEGLMAWYDEQFPGYSFILACFNNSVKRADHPILVWYTPQDKERLFVPGLECHTGQPPVLKGRDHDRDFKVVFGSRIAEENAGRSWRPVDYQPRQDYGIRRGGGFIQEPEPVRYGDLDAILPERIVGFRDENYGSNFDYWASREDVRNGVNHTELFQTMPEHFSGSPLDGRGGTILAW